MAGKQALRDAFLSAMPLESSRRFAALEGLDQTLATLCEDAQRAWPTLDLVPCEFLAHLGSRLAAATKDDAWPELDAASLALAYACSADLAGATAAFLERHEADIAIALRRSGLTPDAAADVRQTVLIKLLGRDGRLRDYIGRGDLSGWVRTVTVREALTWKRRQRDREVPVADPITFGFASSDPEMSFMRAEHREELMAALRETIDALDPRARCLLRGRFVDGLTLDQLAVVHGVHRASVARWLASVRERLQREIRERLAARLRIDASELEHVIGWVRSRLELTLPALLGPPDADGG